MKHIAIMSVLSLLVISTQAGTLRDNFDDGNADEWRLFSGRGGVWQVDQTAQWVVEEGKLVFKSRNVCTVGSLFGIGDDTWKDYEFELRFKIQNAYPSGCGWVPIAGLGVRFDDSNKLISGVDLIIRAQGDNLWNNYKCERFLAGNISNLVVANVSIEQGQWHSARGIVKGDRYRMFIDDLLLCDCRTSPPDAGAAVLIGRNCEVYFDDIIITGDDIPDLDLSVSPSSKLATIWGGVKESELSTNLD